MAPKHQPTVVRTLPVQQLLKIFDRVAHVSLLPGPSSVVDSYHQVSGAAGALHMQRQRRRMQLQSIQSSGGAKNEAVQRAQKRRRLAGETAAGIAVRVSNYSGTRLRSRKLVSHIS